MMEKKLFKAHKRGETRALCLGYGLIVCSIMMHILLVFTAVPLHMKSVWSEKSLCTVSRITFKDNFPCTYTSNSESERKSLYPCLVVQVHLNNSQSVFMLYETEETQEINEECTYIPKCGKNYTETKKDVDDIEKNFKEADSFGCYYDPKGRMESIILRRKFGTGDLVSCFLWPTLMFTLGLFIILLVKISQFFSRISVVSKT
ncbi:putative calcium-activated potassium channel subunit beta [Spea bombifrons]|uniref:putative calcium-activated potassium channel subunit beta n=1 Tax=Spea bombifrons TaxID=233779 RepID=UPI00234AFC38|nr:putative calcium-activated potassium channel subunit beta [Spea bombifrons]XP_053319315.1 putative calcium-activated potassium channel subunit beta [Spea bombifrons]